jgi:deoxyribonuclease IV
VRFASPDGFKKVDFAGVTDICCGCMKIGFHISISKGFGWTLMEAERLSCEVVQIFVKNPRSWAGKELKDEERDSFGTLRARMPVFAHLSYLPNLARIDEDERHMKGFLHEAGICRELGIESMVVHCGSRDDASRGIEMVAEAVNRAVDRYDLNIILETAAGQGRAIGARLTELATIFEKVPRSEKVSLCIDTSHVFQSGYDIRKRKVVNGMILTVERYFGRDKIGLLHLNDSKTELGSRVDRHWHIGEGEIGAGTFKYILNHKKFAGLHGVMETPKTGGMDEVNMKVMRSLLPPLMPGPFS